MPGDPPHDRNVLGARLRARRASLRRHRRQQALLVLLIGLTSTGALAVSASLWNVRPTLLAAYGTPRFLGSTTPAASPSRVPPPAEPAPTARLSPSSAVSPPPLPTAARPSPIATASILPEVRFLRASLASWAIPTEVRIAGIGDDASYRLIVEGVETGSWRIPVGDTARVQVALPTGDAYRFSLQRRSPSGAWEAVSELGPLDLQRLDEGAPGATYQGAWAAASHWRYLGSRVRYSGQRGATVRVTVEGQAVAWLGPSGPTRGVADVFVDGTRVASVDTFARRFDQRRLLFAYAWPAPGTHTVELRVRGTPGRPVVAVDGFLVLAPAAPGAIGAVWTTGPAVLTTRTTAVHRTREIDASGQRAPATVPVLSFSSRR